MHAYVWESPACVCVCVRINIYFSIFLLFFFDTHPGCSKSLGREESRVAKRTIKADKSKVTDYRELSTFHSPLFSESHQFSIKFGQPKKRRVYWYLNCNLAN